MIKFIRDKNPDMHLTGGMLHLVHIAAEKDANTLPVPVDDILIDIFHYMKRSSKRLQKLDLLQVMYGLDQKKM